MNKASWTSIALKYGLMMAALTMCHRIIGFYLSNDSLLLTMFIGLVILAGAIFLIYKALDDYRKAHEIMTFGMGFKIGMAITVVEAFIISIAMFLIFDNASPEFVETQRIKIVDTWIKFDFSEEMLDQMQKDSYTSVQPGSIFFSQWWLLLFVGALISLALSLILRIENEEHGNVEFVE